MDETFDRTTSIAAIQGASNRVVQHAMWRFADRWAGRGARLVGLIEWFNPAEPLGRRAVRLHNLRTGTAYPLFQDLGPMASACHLDGSGIVTACDAICREIEQGCDGVVLSKFGQLEAMRSGLNDAFALAVSLGKPILTSVSPIYDAAWQAFSTPLSTTVPASDAVLDEWWNAVRAHSHVS